MILIGIGSNKAHGEKTPREIVFESVMALRELGKLSALSSLYRSDAWPDPSLPEYANAVVRFEDTSLSPEMLLESLQVIEKLFGRVRHYKNNPASRYAPRTLDLDLLTYHEEIVDTSPELTVPHPGIADRDFVLLPIAEIAPDWQHPVSGQTASAMMAALKHSGAVLTAEPIEPINIK